MLSTVLERQFRRNFTNASKSTRLSVVQFLGQTLYHAQRGDDVRAFGFLAASIVALKFKYGWVLMQALSLATKLDSRRQPTR